MSALKFIAKPELKTLREAKCSQEEMAGLVNIETGKSFGRAFYSNIENGIRPVSSDFALVIARILKVEVTELFTKKTESEE